MLRKIFYTVCLEQRKTKQKKKNSHPKPPESTKNGNHYCQPSKPTPQPTVSQTPTEIDLKPTETHCTKPKIKLQINQIPSISTHWQNHNLELATIKPIMADLVNLKNKNPDLMLCSSPHCAAQRLTKLLRNSAGVLRCKIDVGGFCSRSAPRGVSV